NLREQREPRFATCERPVQPEIEPRVGWNPQVVARGADEDRAVAHGPVPLSGIVAALAIAAARAELLIEPIEAVRIERVALVGVGPERFAGYLIMIARVTVGIRRPARHPAGRSALEREFGAVRVAVERILKVCRGGRRDERAVDDLKVGAQQADDVALLACVTGDTPRPLRREV